ncbi:hypothetical protein B7463_g5069, partial [Scytalidium lignicola]
MQLQLHRAFDTGTAETTGFLGNVGEQRSTKIGAHCRVVVTRRGPIEAKLHTGRAVATQSRAHYTTYFRRFHTVRREREQEQMQEKEKQRKDKKRKGKREGEAPQFLPRLGQLAEKFKEVVLGEGTLVE